MENPCAPSVLLLLLALLIGLPIAPARAQAPERYSSNEILDAGHRFFGGVSRGLAQVVERAFSTWGQPNGYVLGQEGGGAFIGGLRYGEGALYTKNAGDLKVYWQGPTLGWDVGGEGARTMMLIYSLPVDARDLSALRRRRRLGLSGRRRRHDGADLGTHRRGADPLRRGLAARRECRLPEVHPAGDVESVLSRSESGCVITNGTRFASRHPGYDRSPV